MQEMNKENETLVALTADIVSAHLSNNIVAIGDVPALISNVYGALSHLGQELAPEIEKPKSTISVRASIKPDYLVSMIDGKRYKMLKKHIALHGFTPESYRATFDLPPDYPMVAANYAQRRRELAHKIGLGRKQKG